MKWNISVIAKIIQAEADGSGERSWLVELVANRVENMVSDQLRRFYVVE